MPSTSGLFSRFFVLRVELRLRHLHADDGRQPFAEVLADRRQIVLEQLFLAAVGVQRARQGRAEAGSGACRRSEL